MTRLQSELHRLYLAESQAHAEPGALPPALIDQSGRVRAMVMELTAPPSWELLAKVWHGVQDELELPAPAIAVSGLDGLQLWFSLAEPMAVVDAHGFLQLLQLRFLPDIKAGRLRLMPAPEASAAGPQHHAALVPAHQPETGNWSAFVAADLAPVFADTPWIDIPPNEEGQAALLRGIAVIKPPAFEEALRRLAPSPPQAPSLAPSESPVEKLHTPTHPLTAADADDPKAFLLRIMNDDTVALALRIDAAKALLQHSHGHPQQQGD